MKSFGAKSKVRAKAQFLCIVTACALLVIVGACAPAAAPPPTAQPAQATAAPAVAKPTTSPAAPATAAPAAKATTAPAAKATSSALAQLVEAAKKEGKVSVALQSPLIGEPVKEIREGIKKNYGVDLQIEAVPSSSYPTLIAKAISEYKAGVAPSVDMIPTSDASTILGVQAGAAEKVDWAPLLAAGTPREVIKGDGHVLNTFTSHIGMIYNPKAIPAAEVPKSFADLGNPKWKGKIAMFNYYNLYVDFAFVQGPERFLENLRAIAKNDPVLGTYDNGRTRFFTGEYPLLLTQSATMVEAKAAGVAAEWVSLGMSALGNHNLMVLKGTKVPNAAKLLAVFLAGPDGHKIYTKTGRGSLLYPGNAEFEINQQDVKAGLRIFSWETTPGMVEFYNSDKGKQVEKDIGEILQGKQ
ncbi:MAG: ABC transporter substrate-binding protein [Chloroflexi bacterium]|nr:ABC transporter substrate-binding protein [Chloroflexota bacterium]